MRRTLSLLAVVSLGHVLLISAQVQTRRGLPAIQALTYGVFAGVQRATDSVAGGIRSLWTRYVALWGVAAENDALRRRIAELEGQLQQEQAVAGAARALEQALALQHSLAQPTLAARVIAGDPAPGALIVTIDRGSADGLAPDMAVIAAAGVVGRVINRPAAHAAQVQLLISRSAGAGAFMERTGAGGIVVGGVASQLLQMQYVSNLADVRQGDRVMTSGQDGIYPRGFLIGQVERAEQGADLYRDVTVRPAVDFSHLDIVLVVLQKPGPGTGGP